MIVGQRLQELRETHGYSRRELAEKIGIADTQVFRYETGQNDASGEMLARLARFFDVSVDYLLGLSDLQKPMLDVGGLKPDEIALIEARRRGDLRAAIRLLIAED
ncbi:MAG: helix-turn-helix transcriptional regulator [Anaerolineae bacterium]|nr:helix-turn-helix transcriptional regulator [Anaerolineae bacterium]